MKDKVLMFIIGFLVGAIITTCGFLIYEKTKSKNSVDNKFPRDNMPQMMERNGNMENRPTPPQMQEGEETPQMQEGEEPPQMPNDLSENKSKKSKTTDDENNTNLTIENKINEKTEKEI